MIRRLQRHSVSTQMALLALMVAVAASIVLAGGTALQAYLRTGRQIERELRHVERDLMPTLSDMAWTMNAVQITSLVRGIVASPVVAAVEVEVFGLSQVSSGMMELRPGRLLRELPIPAPAAGLGETIGTLRLITYSRFEVMHAQNEIGRTIAVEVAAMALIVLAMYALARLVVTEPLRRLRNVVDSVRPGASFPTDIPGWTPAPPSPRDHNELHAVYRALAEAFGLLQAEIAERRRVETDLQNSLHEKTILLREVHHRVKNNLQIVVSLLALQNARSEDGAARHALTDSEHRIQSMALVHELLYQSSTLSDISLQHYVSELARNLLPGGAAGEPPVLFEVTGDECTIGIDVAIPIGLVVNELITNAVQHAFGGVSERRIVVRLQECPECRMNLSRLQVRDTGHGFPPGMDWKRSPSLGLQIVQSLADQLGAALQVQSSTEGTTFDFWFPSH